MKHPSNSNDIIRSLNRVRRTHSSTRFGSYNFETGHRFGRVGRRIFMTVSCHASPGRKYRLRRSIPAPSGRSQNRFATPPPMALQNRRARPESWSFSPRTDRGYKITFFYGRPDRGDPARFVRDWRVYRSRHGRAFRVPIRARDYWPGSRDPSSGPTVFYGRRTDITGLENVKFRPWRR